MYGHYVFLFTFHNCPAEYNEDNLCCLDRRFHLEQELRLMLWKVNYEDIVFTQRTASERRNSLVCFENK